MADPQLVQSLLGGRSTAVTSPPAATADQSKVRDLATQFESMLLSQMLKDLQTSMADDDDGSAGFKSGPLGDVMNSELGLSLSRGGGFGLADLLSSAMARQTGIGGPDAGASSTNPVGLPGTGATGDPGEAVAQAYVQTYSVPQPVISSAYGWRKDPIDGGEKFHKGIDVPVPVGTDVKAPTDGRVVSVGQESGYGLTVVVAHGNGLESRYAHLSAAGVRPGDAVHGGEVIARSGNTGRSTGPHLHFEVTNNGQAVNPAGWLGAVVSAPASGQ